MSRPTPNNESLVQLVERYADQYRRGATGEAILEKIGDLLPRLRDPAEFHPIAEQLWSKFAPWYDIPTMMQILRRWIEIEPESKEAKATLGTFLLMHGPDWDEEGKILIEEAKMGT